MVVEGFSEEGARAAEGEGGKSERGEGSLHLAPRVRSKSAIETLCLRSLS